MQQTGERDVRRLHAELKVGLMYTSARVRFDIDVITLPNRRSRLYVDPFRRARVPSTTATDNNYLNRRIRMADRTRINPRDSKKKHDCQTDAVHRFQLH